MYIPPFTITDEILNLVADICGHVGRIEMLVGEKYAEPMLRKKNRILTIHSSLAIEQNTLSLQQVTDVINGKHVLAHPREIQEVKNALEAYNLMIHLDAFNEKDLLRVHGLMMENLVRNAGHYRQEDVGVFDGNGNCLHMAPPSLRVAELMGDLFEWVKKSKAHPLIRSCVFHYEFEFIHPFIDGNGRMGRYWQTMLLSRWKPVLGWLPVENIVRENQEGYYQAIAKCDSAGESTIFIEFMLKCLYEAIIRIEEHREVPNKVANKVPNKTAVQILDLLKKNGNLTRKELSEQMGLSDSGVKKILSSLRNDGFIERVGANKNGYWKVNE